jgi:exopolysaccharide biosynthesis protein
VAAALALAVAGTVGGGVAWGVAGSDPSPGAAAARTSGHGSHNGHDGKADWLPPTPAGWPLVVDHTSTPTETVTRGLQHYSETYDTVGGRQHIQVLTADLGDPNLRVGMVEADDTLTDPADETSSSMAHRTGAVAGVNGGYFAINASGVPDGGIMTDGRLLKSPQPGYAAQLGVKPDGSMVMGPETFSGTITDGAASRALTSLNTVADVASGGITEVTPDLGETSVPASTLVVGHTAGAGLVVDSVQPNVTTVPRLAAGQLGLLGAGAGGQWLTANVHGGDPVGVSSKLSPDNDLTQMISGVDILVKDGKAYQDPTGTPPTGAHPETAVGITKDGKHAIVVAIDGEQGATTAFGVTPDQVAGYLLAHGAWTAELFDGGGSTTMVSRAPGADQAEVVNTPSDLPGNTERKVANGIFFYSTAKAAGPAVKVVVNGGDTVTTVDGGSIPLPVHAVDRFANPAAGQIKVRIEPASLATYAAGKLVPKRTGTGRIIATDGRTSTSEKLQVVSRPASLSVSPDQADLDNGATQQLTLSGTVKGGGAVQIPAEAATWKVSPAGLGTVDAHGLFTASTDQGGLADVTAQVGGATATTSIAVGRVAKAIDPMDDAAAWHLSNNTTGYPATLSADPGVVPPGSTDSGSLKLDYTMPAGSGVKQLVIAPKATLTTDTDNGQVPTGIGLWVKDGGPSSLELAESYINVDGSVNTPIYLTGVTSDGWRLAVTQLPAGLKFPLTVNWIDFLGINPSTSYTGSLNIAGLQALYSPRPVSTPAYQAVPQNPGWLSYEEDSADFAKRGKTLLTGDDAHMLAADPGSVSSNVMDSIAERLPTLAPQARPDAAQFLGDMSDDGKQADLEYAKSKMDELGIPERDIVGNHEITQGSDPENGNYSGVFGATHYAYAEGAAQVIVTDNSHGSLQSSDPYQDPTGEQYPWLVQQLTDTTAKDVLVTTHMPAYDPHPAANSQFTDRWEARMYLRLVQRYQQTHPEQHVIMLYGHARGFSEQILDPEGRSVTTAQGGIPQLTFADLGMPAYAPADQGGFYHYGLIRIGTDGDLQFSVEPALASITVQAPAAPVAAGHRVTLTATGDQTAGDNIAPLTIPIADPASHVWTSSNPRVASVDRATGVLTAHRHGTVTVTVTSGGVKGSTQVTVR